MTINSLMIAFVVHVFALHTSLHFDYMVNVFYLKFDVTDFIGKILTLLSLLY